MIIYPKNTGDVAVQSHCRHIDFDHSHRKHALVITNLQRKWGRSKPRNCSDMCVVWNLWDFEKEGWRNWKVCWNYDSTLFTLDQEWKAILKAKGFGMPFDQWVCKEVQWTLLPKYLPPLEWICALADVIKLAFQEKHSNDEKQHKKHMKWRMIMCMDMTGKFINPSRNHPNSSFKVCGLPKTSDVNFFAMLQMNAS